MKIKCLVLIALSIFFLPFTTYAWNALGHKVIAKIAYENLKPAVRERIDTLVADMSQQYHDMETFVDLACWPDQIRGQKIETYTHWHYIDVAFSVDQTPVKNLIDTDNALWAVNKIAPIVKNQHANPYERSRFLAFYAHIVGDLHQPLHTVSYISAHFPNGDKGGNGYTVIYQNKKQNLHHIWDSGVGIFEGASRNERVNELANQLMAQYPESYFQNKASDLKAENWVAEGMINAQSAVYTIPPSSQVTETYQIMGKRLSAEQAVLAGYRLAKLLNQLFG